MYQLCPLRGVRFKPLLGLPPHNLKLIRKFSPLSFGNRKTVSHSRLASKDVASAQTISRRCSGFDAVTLGKLIARKRIVIHVDEEEVVVMCSRMISQLLERLISV
jgi:hypothetical protein